MGAIRDREGGLGGNRRIWGREEAGKGSFGGSRRVGGAVRGREVIFRGAGGFGVREACFGGAGGFGVAARGKEGGFGGSRTFWGTRRGCWRVWGTGRLFWGSRRVWGVQEGLRDREGVFGGQLKAGRGYFGEQLGSGGGQRGVFRGSRTVWGVREGVFQPPVTSRVSVSLVGSTSLHSLSLGGGGCPPALVAFPTWWDLVTVTSGVPVS